MEYSDAQRLVPGTPVRTDAGEIGAVLTTYDTGTSVLVQMRRDDGRVLDVHGARVWPLRVGGSPAAHDAPVRPGYYRVRWSVDLPKDEFASPAEAADHACELAGDCGGPVNVFEVVDGDDGRITEHDLAG